MKPRYYFPLPDSMGPSGGGTVQYRVADTLKSAGYDVGLVHAGRRYRYPFVDTTVQVYAFPKLARTTRLPLIRRLRSFRPGIGRAENTYRRTDDNPLLERSPADVFVLPEYSYGEYGLLFPDAPLILAAQDAFGLARAFTRDLASNSPTQRDRIRGVYATSRVSCAAVSTLLELSPHLIGLPVGGQMLRPDKKKLQIAYMPRRRQEECTLILNALRCRLGETMPPTVAIAGVSDEERNQILRESLIFLSFSHKEGFGLPPAEAMAAGCITVGYTGVGGDEYFTPETGFPIQDCDIIGFIRQIETILTEYRDNPARLDALRLHASEHIARAYSLRTWQEKLLAAWEILDQTMRHELTARVGGF